MQKWQTTAKALAMEYTVHSLLAAAHSQAMAKVALPRGKFDGVGL